MPANFLRGHRPDYVLLATAGLLVVLGLIFLTSASSVLGLEKWGDSYYYLKHQLRNGFLPGIVCFFIFAHLPYQRLKVLALPCLILSFVLLGLVFVPGLGSSSGGATRWLELGGIRVQPSEFVKLMYLVYLAAWLEGRGVDRLRSIKSGIIPFALITSAVGTLIVLQPDLGTASVIAVSAFVTYLVAGGNLMHLSALGALGLGTGVIVVRALSHSVQRLSVFLHPELDPQGIGYHINQALLAVGSGGFFGQGLGYSRQKYQYLPEVMGDSVFAVVAEELGFIFTMLFIGLIGFFLWRGFHLARRAPDEFGRLLSCGVMVWLGWQTCINIASMLNLLPLTGVPMPFVSYGGSALTIVLCALGMLSNISRQAKGGTV